MHGLVCNEDPALRSNDLQLKLENPLGFFESKRLVDVNEALFELIGRTWQTPPLLAPRWDMPPLLESLQPFRSRLSDYALNRFWVDKDPRLCITYPAFLHILLRRVPLVIALREPFAVAMSLYARNGFSFNSGLLLWLLYNHHIASQLNSGDLLVTYESLLRLADPVHESVSKSEINNFLERNGCPRPDDSCWEVLLQHYLCLEYNRSQQAISLGNFNNVSSLLAEVCTDRYLALQLANDHFQRIDIFREQFASIPRIALELINSEQMLPEAKYVNHHFYCHQLESDLRNAREMIDDQSLVIEHQQLQLKALYASSSWRLTSPLRMFINFVRRLDG